MPVQWGRVPTRPVGPEFVKVYPQRYVHLLTAPDSHAVILVHWSDLHNGSFPCLGDDCELCPASTWQTTYAPCLVWQPKLKKWTRGILPLGHPDNDLARHDLTRVPIVLAAKEPGKKERAKSIIVGRFESVANVAPPPPTAAFDVRPWLMRRWGLFKEADLLECEFHPGDLLASVDELQAPANEKRKGNPS